MQFPQFNISLVIYIATRRSLTQEGARTKPIKRLLLWVNNQYMGKENISLLSSTIFISNITLISHMSTMKVGCDFII